ncbi:hypothetical protein MVQ25_07820 [Fusobacterium necrophorum]|uniref:hypothetical protein n=1 Tax=Fusobacterium necrophorum TaxID=859 RepID=UPI00254CDB7D|nr:hypothetical protein [Fusobacterium necrophorum]MDK4497893.1 hypothetical protein [Fusobacterium necrophorum]
MAKKERYVFSKKKYIESKGEKEYLKSKEWVDKYDGVEVTHFIRDSFKFEPDAHSVMFVHRDWCKKKK